MLLATCFVPLIISNLRLLVDLELKVYALSFRRAGCFDSPVLYLLLLDSLGNLMKNCCSDKRSLFFS